jgi:hypothetical protein
MIKDLSVRTLVAKRGTRSFANDGELTVFPFPTLSLS